MRLFSWVFLFFFVSAATVQAAQNYTLNDDLLYRINFGSAEDVKVLLNQGADPNSRTRQGETALNVAIERNDGESEPMAEALVEKGADIETPDKDGFAPIIIAVKFKMTGLVKLMIAKGANYHTNAPDGTPLIDYARKYGNPEMVKVVQDLIGKEEAYAASLRTPERFHEMSRLYAMDSCTYQYWSFFVASRQAPDKEKENQKKVDQAKIRLTQIITEIQKYYTPASTDAMVKVANVGVRQVYDQLDSMISNMNRTEKGVGRDEDAKERCDKIIAALPLSFVPVALSDGSVPAPAAPRQAPKTAVPLPMDPSATQDPGSHGTPIK